MLIGRFLFASAAIILAGSVARAESEPQNAPARFSSSSELVVVHVTVKDRRGAYVTDLPVDAFTVFEDEQPNPISVFTAVDSPVTVGLIVDASGSMRERRNHVLAAVTAFAAASHPQDELFALTFSETVRSVLPASTPFTTDPSMLQGALDRSIHANGRSALYDAIHQGLAHVGAGRHPRRVLVLIADGGDNASRTTFEQVLREAQASNAAIYAVGVIDPLDRDANRERLRDLARATGGEAFFPRRVDDVANILRHIADDIRHTYTIGFVPPDSHHDGAFHRLRVQVRSPDRRRLTVRARDGYRASLAPSTSSQ